jgi:hypothetical protein
MDIEQLYSCVKNSRTHQTHRINLGNILELIITDDCVDIYKYIDPNSIDDDYDFDSDYITTIYME